MALTIRTGTSADAGTITDFNQRLAEETEGKRLDQRIVSAGVEAALNDSGRATYYLVCDGERIVGQLMITLEWSDWRNGNFWWIESVYVDQQYRQKGVFRLLYEHVKTLAQNLTDVCGIRLYVEKENTRAQQTYLKMGMDITDYLIMEEEF